MIGCVQKEPVYRIAYNVLEDRETQNYEVITIALDGTDRQNVTNRPGVEWTYYAYENKLTFISDLDTCTRCYFLWECDWDGSNPVKLSTIQLKDSWMASRNAGNEFVLSPKGDSAFVIVNRNGTVSDRIVPGFTYASDPTFSPDGKQIVFRGTATRIKGTGYLAELYVMNDDGTNMKQITWYPQDDTVGAWYRYRAGPPVWEPNHNFITYTSVRNGKGKIFAIQSDGTGLKQITPDTLDVGWHAWSSNGKWLTFDAVRKEDNFDNYDIYLMAYPEGPITRLTTDKKYEQAPVFVEVKD
jgi:TolB protein